MARKPDQPAVVTSPAAAVQLRVELEALKAAATLAGQDGVAYGTYTVVAADATRLTRA